MLYSYDEEYDVEMWAEFVCLSLGFVSKLTDQDPRFQTPVAKSSVSSIHTQVRRRHAVEALTALPFHRRFFSLHSVTLELHTFWSWQLYNFSTGGLPPPMQLSSTLSPRINYNSTRRCLKTNDPVPDVPTAILIRLALVLKLWEQY
jgi:hypothetical protein